MSRLSVDLRHRALAIWLSAIISMLAALTLTSAPCMAAGQNALTELNRQIATTLRTLEVRSHASVAVQTAANAMPSVNMPLLPASSGRRFVLPAWALPFTRASRLLHVRSGDLVFDGWGALRPGGVVRLQYTLRL